MTKIGLGLLRRGERTLMYGKGAVAGGFVFLSGVEGVTDAEDRPVVGIETQTTLMLDRLRSYLADADAKLDQIVKAVWMVSDRALLPEFFAVRDAWMAEHAPQLRDERSFASTLTIVGLATPEMLVEVDVIAHVGP